MVTSSFWNRFFGREENSESKNVAKERLRLVLVHDRLDMSEQVMNSLREDLIAVIGKYLEIDEKALDVSLTREEEGVALVANIPILNVRHQRRDDTAQRAEATEKAPPAPEKPATTTKSKKNPPKKNTSAKNNGAEAAKA